MKSLLLLAALFSSVASAHTAVLSLSPQAFAVVKAPKSIEMTFSEPIDLHFCTFKVYPLGVIGDKLNLSRAAAQFTQSKVNIKNDEAVRADLAPKLSGMAAKLSLPLKSDLKAGNYAVIWRILSEDGHIVTGQSVFAVK